MNTRAAFTRGRELPTRLLAGATLAAMVPVLLAARLEAPLPACPFKALTGLDCPGCGSGRALAALTHGEVVTALDHNLVLPFLAPLVIVSLTGASLGRTPLLSRRGWARAILLLVAGFWALRLLPFDALSYLDSGTVP